MCESSTSLTGESHSDATDADAPPDLVARGPRVVLGGSQLHVKECTTDTPLSISHNGPTNPTISKTTIRALTVRPLVEAVNEAVLSRRSRFAVPSPCKDERSAIERGRHAFGRS